jgi:hypothetical protein
MNASQEIDSVSGQGETRNGKGKVLRQYRMHFENDEDFIAITESNWQKIKSALLQRPSWLGLYRDISLLLFGLALGIPVALVTGQVPESYRIIAVVLMVSLMAFAGSPLVIYAMRQNMDFARANELVQDVEHDHGSSRN